MKHCGRGNCGSLWFPICNADDINSYIDHDDDNKDNGSYLFVCTDLASSGKHLLGSGSNS